MVCVFVAPVVEAVIVVGAILDAGAEAAMSDAGLAAPFKLKAGKAFAAILGAGAEAAQGAAMFGYPNKTSMEL
ncbi:hypothetical protein lerEdw1_003061 [Lerista edwardsae]|nr:hypothetical protein lerEdw1_003061 [Lerista edwardsae]